MSKDPTNKYKSFDIIKDQKAVILRVKVKKKSLGLLLQFDTQHKVVFINDIVNSTNLVFEIGDQILDINGIGIYSTEDITDVMGKTGIGNVVEFKIKRPKKVKEC